MIRILLASFILCTGLVAVEPDELPALGLAAPAKAAPAAAAAEAQTQREAETRALVATEATKQAAEAKAQIPTPAAEQDLSLRWTERGTLPPRLAADLVARSAPAIRPIAADYRLKAGDLVRVVAWGGQAVNERIPVAPNGDLAVPGFGLVPVAGATASEAQGRVLELVRSHFKQGGAVVAVEQPAAQAVTVVGEVAKPGYLVLPPGGTVLEALAAAGGVLPRGSLRMIRIAAGGEPAVVDLYRVAVDGDAGVLAPLPAGALVFVPLAGPQVQVFGAVRRMSGIELKPGETLAEALRLAGGLSADADPAAIRVLREGAGGQELRQIAAEALAGLPAADGDRLLVSLRRDLGGTTQAIRITGAVRSPGVYPLGSGLSLEQALALAGGLLPQGDPGRVRVQRLLAEPQLVIEDGVPSTVHFATLVSPPAASALLAHDEVVVPERPKPDPTRSGVSVSGAVGKPGLYAFTPGMTVRDLVLLADQVLPAAQVDQANLVRSQLNADGVRSASTLTIDLRPILAGRESGPALLPGDALIVRTTADGRVRVTLTGQFRSTGTFTVPAGATLGQIAKLAGGTLPEAFPRGARLFRKQEAEVAKQFLADLLRRTETSLAINKRAALDAEDDEAKADAERNIARQEVELTQLRQATATGRMAGVHLEGILAGDTTADQVLQDGDSIDLPARPGTVRILGEVLVPGSLVYADGLSAKDVIKRSGGLTRQADEDAVFVVRADGSVVATAQGDTLAWDHERRRWARTSLSGLKLLEGDAVIIPADVRYQDSNRRIVRDWTQIMFQVAATVGTIAVIAK
jgi:polysaccharide export outer membrane protein